MDESQKSEAATGNVDEGKNNSTTEEVTSLKEMTYEL
jgi:hypothetical protein